MPKTTTTLSVVATIANLSPDIAIIRANILAKLNYSVGKDITAANDYD